MRTDTPRCVTDESGAETCITKAQLDALIAGQTAAAAAVAPVLAPVPRDSTPVPDAEGGAQSAPPQEVNSDPQTPEATPPEEESPPAQEVTSAENTEAESSGAAEAAPQESEPEPAAETAPVIENSPPIAAPASE